MAMTLAFSGTEYDDEDGVHQLTQVASGAGMRHVELWYPKNYALYGVSSTRARLADAGMSVACISTPSTLYGSGRDRARELLYRALQLAEECGAGIVNTYFGHADVADDEEAAAEYARLVTPIVQEAGERGVTVTLENEFDAFGWDPAGSDITRRPASLERLCSRVNHPAFKLNFDAANFHCASVDVLTEAYPLLHEHIGYVHVKNVRTIPSARGAQGEQGEPAAPEPGWLRFTDHGKVFDTAPVDKGEVDWPRLLGALAKQGYAGYLTLEPHCAKARLADEVAAAARSVRAALAEAGALH
ncbi:sugar phosphate isomerase/epimerase family protein [Streptomyces chrestomyceticus]|uniref:sugar phosphate isomerase/epimerase family protein n=2 Tax=Streptomyces chrestomyceticus TaxID=68185 RepID=UPI003405F8E7